MKKLGIKKLYKRRGRTTKSETESSHNENNICCQKVCVDCSSDSGKHRRHSTDLNNKLDMDLYPFTMTDGPELEKGNGTQMKRPSPCCECQRRRFKRHSICNTNELNTTNGFIYPLSMARSCEKCLNCVNFEMMNSNEDLSGSYNKPDDDINNEVHQRTNFTLCSVEDKVVSEKKRKHKLLKGFWKSMGDLTPFRRPYDNDFHLDNKSDNTQQNYITIKDGGHNEIRINNFVQQKKRKHNLLKGLWKSIGNLNKQVVSNDSAVVDVDDDKREENCVCESNTQYHNDMDINGVDIDLSQSDITITHVGGNNKTSKDNAQPSQGKNNLATLNENRNEELCKTKHDGQFRKRAVSLPLSNQGPLPKIGTATNGAIDENVDCLRHMTRVGKRYSVPSLRHSRGSNVSVIDIVRTNQMSVISQLDKYMEHLTQSKDNSSLASIPNRMCCALLLRTAYQRRAKELFSKYYHN